MLLSCSVPSYGYSDDHIVMTEIQLNVAAYFAESTRSLLKSWRLAGKHTDGTLQQGAFLEERKPSIQMTLSMICQTLRSGWPSTQKTWSMRKAQAMST